MLWGAPKLVVRVMQLTFLSSNFKTWLLVLAIGSFLLSWTAERQLFPRLARILGRVYMLLRPGHRKRRRQYKVLLENMLTWRRLMSNEPTLDNGIDKTTELNTNSNKYRDMCPLCPDHWYPRGRPQFRSRWNTSWIEDEAPWNYGCPLSYRRDN